MSKAYDALMKELEDEQQNAPSETPNTETPPAPEEHVEQPAETPADGQSAETPAEHPEDTPAPAETPKPSEEQPAPKKPSEYTPEERAQFAFQRQLSKQKQTYEKQIADITTNFQKQIDELKKATKQPEPVKTRADFENDDAYIKYLADKQVNEIMAERDKKASEDAAEKARQQAEQDEAQRTLEAEQQAWLANVDAAYGEDAKGKQAFLSRLQMCMDKGLGAVLDACPTASEFLLRSAGGPKVLAHLINDRASFERVFNDRSTPLDQYYELRSIEAELKAQPSATPAPQSAAPAPTPAQMPHIGRPGKSGGATQPDIFEDPAEMRAFLRSR